MFGRSLLSTLAEKRPKVWHCARPGPWGEDNRQPVYIHACSQSWLMELRTSAQTTKIKSRMSCRDLKLIPVPFSSSCSLSSSLFLSLLASTVFHLLFLNSSPRPCIHMEKFIWACTCGVQNLFASRSSLPSHRRAIRNFLLFDDFLSGFSSELLCISFLQTHLSL